MRSEEIVSALNANIGKRVRVTFGDGLVQHVIIDSVDKEGFLHSGPDGENAQGFWTRFEDVTLLEPEAQS
jgi:hypothetical protein